MLIGAIEAGGTKFVCGIGNEKGEIYEHVSFPTLAPEKTIKQVLAYFEGKQLEAIGIGSFGPLNVDSLSPNYGNITTTPKQGWTDYPFLSSIKQHFNIPCGWDTDVNAAAYGEVLWGAAQGLNSCVYFTVGTGIGAGVYVEGKLLHGLIHPEGGHILPRRHPEDKFVGNCTYHGDCLEGMAAGPAIEKRWNCKGNALPKDHPAWEIQAYYLAQAVVSTILLLSPQRIVLGGGVMKQEQLFPLIRQEVQRQLNGYVQSEALLGRINEYIVPTGLDGYAGLYGALALGVKAANDCSNEKE